MGSMTANRRDESYRDIHESTCVRRAGPLLFAAREALHTALTPVRGLFNPDCLVPRGTE